MMDRIAHDPEDVTKSVRTMKSINLDDLQAFLPAYLRIHAEHLFASRRED
jgi:hypothetical protein